MKHRIIRTFGIVLASVIVLASAVPAQTPCKVTYTTSPQNTSQFGATVSIQNLGTTTLSNWSLTWTFANGQTIANSWNGAVTQSGANVTVSEQAGQTWQNIPAGGSYTGFGFNGTWNGTTNAVPTNFALNGTACNSSLTATTTALTSSATSVATGTSVTLTATVTPSTATGTVTFMDGTTSLGTGTLSSGKATLATSFSTAGTHSITAVYGGSTTFAGSTSPAVSITVTSTLTATTTALTASPTSVATGATVTLTATVSPSTATGTVTFLDGTTSLGTGTLSSGKATLATSFSTAGTHSITAVYGGSTTFATSTSSAVAITVTSTLTATTTALTSSATSVATGATVTLTATVSPSTATGTVTFMDGTTSLGTGTLSSGKATLATSFSTAGTHSITAVYGGSTTFAGSTSPVVSITVTSTLTATTTALTSSATSVSTGTSVTLTATVSPSTATGTVTFLDGTTSLGTGTLSSGKATLATSFSTAGTHSITAVYGGSTTFATSTSSAVTITVTSTLTATTTSLAASTTTPAVGASVTLTATVSPSTATGTVTFFSGTTSLGTGTLSSGVATLTTSFATAGTDSLTATYDGSTTFATSTSSAVSVTVSTGSFTPFQQHFVDLYTDIHTSSNGYFGTATSGDQIPYHSVETLMAEAPDYGHETSSETYSYWVWLETLYGGLTSNWTGLQTAWTSLQDNMIPSATLQPTNSGYNASAPATYAPEHPLPSAYPSVLTSSVSVGTDPLASQLSSTYGNDNMYSMHWIIDTDNFYGFGQQEDGVTKPSCMNTFQRGANESVFLTVPQPCWDNLKYGSETNGYLDLFTAPAPYTNQWKYTDAPDADARTVQAMYWAEQYANAQGGNSIVTALLPKAAELGDYLRYAFFDKYFKEMGCIGASASATSCPAGSGYNSAHYLLGWYFAWGGAIPADGSWAWRIGDGTAHFGYQNPVAAYALSKDPGISGKLPAQSVTDWSTSLERQLELYRWAQSDEGAIAGGVTNSWEGSYSPTPTGDSTFYNMAYDWEPVYHNPPSNQWFGMQTWSMERLAEYYYITGDSKAAIVLNSWIPWVEKSTTVNSDGTFTLPGSLCWDNSPGQGDTTNPWNDSTCGLVDSSTANKPATNWNATTQDWTTVPLNPNLHVRVTGTATDIGLAGSLAKALSYYSAAVGKWGSSGTPDATSEALAKSLLTGVWTNYRDSIGISVAETRSDYCTSTTSSSTEGGTTLNGGFGATVFVPSTWSPGTMPAGEDITVSPQPTFLSLRPKYKNDPNFAALESGCAAGTGPTFNYHRFWAQVDIASAYAVFANLFPGN
ncbi:MAG: glycoside hydrolase family 48 protein [Terracidiphilus sp.]|jgi:hypothetical protein